MRKLHTTILGMVCLCSTSSLFSQTNPEVELAKQASYLYRSSNADAFFTWFTSPTCSNLLLFLMFASILYFLAMLTLFLLINREVIKVKENALVHILLEDWLTEKEKILLSPIEKMEPVIKEKSPTESMIPLNLPNSDILSMETESAKMAIG